jgi:hypothetical protein
MISSQLLLLLPPCPPRLAPLHACIAGFDWFC